MNIFYLDIKTGPYRRKECRILRSHTHWPSAWSTSRRYPCTDARPTETCVAPVDASRDFYFLLFLRTSSGGGWGGGIFRLFSFPCSAHNERDWPPCKVVFSGWQPIRWMWETTVLAAVDPPKHFDIFPPLTGGCSEGPGVFWFFFKRVLLWLVALHGDSYKKPVATDKEPRNPLTRWDVSSIPANRIFSLKN